MSLSLSFSSALSGLHVASRGTRLVADNIANAQTRGYAVRSLDQSAQVLGGAGNGVRAVGVHRDIDQGLLNEHRNAVSSAAQQGSLTQFWLELERSFGMPDEQGSLVHQIGRLEDALATAAANPESDVNLQVITNAANALTRNFNLVETTLLNQRDAADASIARDVAELNTALEEIARLNREIQRQTLLGGTPQALMDRRQALIDDVAEIIPVTEIPREDGRSLLLAQDGTVLADRGAAEFGFDRTTAISPADLVQTGALSQLRVNGKTVTSDSALMAEGRLGAAFEIRDVLGPSAQDELDTLAADLVTRFMAPDADPTLPTGAFGLFAISGESTVPATLTGIAGRMAVNAAVDPEKGGDIWRLRAGIGAPGPGFVADNSQLSRMAAALTRPLALGVSGIVSRSVHGHATDVVSRLSAKRLATEVNQSSADARLAAVQDTLGARGVDTDAELSKLLRLEQAYAANARVLSTVDAMLRNLMEI